MYRYIYIYVCHFLTFSFCQNTVPSFFVKMNGLYNGAVLSNSLKTEELLEKCCMPLPTKKLTNTELYKFQKLIEKKYGLHFDSYCDFHKWSVENIPAFWKELWHHFDIISSRPYDEVFKKTGNGFMDNEWFIGSKLNVAENIMRIRDEKIALICCDELGNRETVTFAEIYEQVQLYTAAFRKHGLKCGDRVAYYISNRKEALFAMLASLSVGAIWGGPLPYHGPRMASLIMQKVNPKFIISVDHFQADGKQYYPIDNLPFVAKNLPNLEKVIIVPTKEETLYRDMSDIPKSILLEDFLQSGMTPDGTGPELEFKQLPFNHPTIINFTSGTTGDPKGVVHSAGVILCQLRDFSLHLNLQSGDIVYTNSAVGWAVWDYVVPNLALGVTLLLYDGIPIYKKNFNFWNMISENKVNFVFISQSYIDDFEQENILPGPETNLDCLKVIALGGSPVKPQDYQFLINHIKKDLYIVSHYGASETFGAFSGCDLSSTLYTCECQVPALGVDLQVFDEKGDSVVGKRGEIVITKPYPGLPIYLWDDEKNQKMNETYLSKYQGVWCQNDEGWINPVTKGFQIVGRSDETLKQYGERLSPGDIYFAISEMKELEDYICVGQDRWDGESRAVLFVKLKQGYSFTPELKEKISKNIRKELPDVPEEILEIPDVPYNHNGKKMESLVKKIVKTNTVPEIKSITNPDCLQFFCNIPELIKFNKPGI
ncbi:acetoacetyl-CoA synthetase-like isoform X1 [Argiope bruennichi]|uniref:acetoacetyl-CoA synthetase-like isoform X1 n=2 Tax=Argiope bruennichi TaxID=94029 RepID=UPI002494FE2A|nr:acetoacetyl-CoA synthetase-like isoform X1 [Argiope bruennichi]